MDADTRPQQLTAVTIGNFDGVHVGHAELLRRARLAVGPDGRVVALAFHPHPVTVLAPDRAPVALTTFEQRSATLRSAGADEVERLEPTRELLGTPAEAFVRKIAERYRPAAIVEGSDFRFGRGRAGDVETLRAFGHAWPADGLGFETLVVDPVRVVLTGGLEAEASSTLVRWLVERGRVADASRVLGRPYEIAGTVIRGDQRGRTIGVPTANLETVNPLPADGVYAGVAVVPGGATLPAAVHVGARETFDSRSRTVEAHIVDWAGPGTEDGDTEPVYAYGWPVVLRLLAFVRDQARYDGVDALCEQMRRDIGRSAEIAGRYLAGTWPPGPAGLAATIDATTSAQRDAEEVRAT